MHACTLTYRIHIFILRIDQKTIMWKVTLVVEKPAENCHPTLQFPFSSKEHFSAFQVIVSALCFQQQQAGVFGKNLWNCATGPSPQGRQEELATSWLVKKVKHLGSSWDFSKALVETKTELKPKETKCKDGRRQGNHKEVDKSNNCLKNGHSI